MQTMSVLISFIKIQWISIPMIFVPNIIKTFVSNFQCSLVQIYWNLIQITLITPMNISCSEIFWDKCLLEFGSGTDNNVVEHKIQPRW